MIESGRLPELVQDRIDAFLDSRTSILAPLGSDALDFAAVSREFLRGGKRFRALFCWWGWRAFAPSGSPSPETVRVVVSAAASLEIFHAAALVHDDIIDNSDTRRGAPAAHVRFASTHAESDWRGDAGAFGRSSGILLGDLLLGWSDELLDEALESLPDRRVARAARLEFNRMRSEVTAGQYLDILEEQAWGARTEAEQFEAAWRVIRFKSAGYSIESPLVLGAALAGADPATLDALRAFGLPLGIAFQLRDDVLGVFGDASVTGKPSGDDLREGKRTVLIALTRAALPAPHVRIVDELLGDAELDDAGVASLQATIRECGALDRVEDLIRSHTDDSLAALAALDIDDEARSSLARLAHAVTDRKS
ncbi:polyprenyl synthetase family protein [Labedella endophytica]|uniref:Polyprenyl synthetase family protein n=1 Tax=Labedella endophytica TaxID=1523160 RepID=A0A3S0XZT6_9MICO|nr:polyprenyl synthetase family protein [Labedella endophytica]RUR00825.1 polyprenyl synthetase family protein [Labedella endophytica]